ncbi:MAG: mucoidy inhibitor MuiA family protein, partial [Flavobacteriales bacterium]
MTKFLSILVFALSLSSSVLSQTTIEAPISDVTVFLSQAQVTRTAEVQLKAGAHQLVVSGLTSRLNPNSVIVSGSSDFTIQGVKHEQVFDQSFQPSSPIQLKQDSLEDLQFDLSIKQATEKVYQEELSFIQANRSIKGNEAVLLVEDIQEMADFWRERVKEIQFRQLELREEQKYIQEGIQRIQQELNKMNSWRNKNQSQITISIDVKKAGKIPVVLSYVVYDASWAPTYDIRTKSTSENVQLSYKGKVRQATGNDWSNVNLTLSSGNPAIGGNPPNLSTWYLRNGGTRGDNDKYRKANAPAYG